jgi:hypothetical protein
LAHRGRYVTRYVICRARACPLNFPLQRYQIFKITHILLLLIALITMIVHRPQGYGWVLAGTLIWALDRFGRAARLLYNHFFKPIHVTSRGQPRAWVEALSADTIRLTVTTTQTWVRTCYRIHPLRVDK